MHHQEYGPKPKMQVPSRTAPSFFVDSHLAREIGADYAEACEASSTPVEFADECEALEWDVTGIDAIHLRAIKRQIHKGVDTVFWVNGPGLIAALPEKLRRNPKSPGTSRKSAFWDDYTLVDRFCGTMTHRGRGLTEHDELVIAEMRARAAWLPGMKPVGLPTWLRARCIRAKMPPIAAAILDLLAAARCMSRIGLEYSNAQMAFELDCHPRSIRRAIAWLERYAMVWRQATSRPGAEESDRPVDQHHNFLIPGPRWLREVEPWIVGTDEERDAMASQGRASLSRRRAAKRRTVAVEPPSYEEWAEAAVATEELREDVVGEASWIADVESAKIHATLLSDFESGAEARARGREEIGRRVEEIAGRFSRDVFEGRSDRLSSNWEDRKTSRSLTGTSSNRSRSDGLPSQPRDPRRARNRPPTDRPALSLAAEIADAAGFDSRPARGGDWYDDRHGDGAANDGNDHEAEIARAEAEHRAAWARRWSQSAASPPTRPVLAVASSGPASMAPPEDGVQGASDDPAAERLATLAKVANPELADLARALFEASDERQKIFFRPRNSTMDRLNKAR